MEQDTTYSKSIDTSGELRIAEKTPAFYHPIFTNDKRNQVKAIVQKEDGTLGFIFIDVTQSESQQAKDLFNQYSSEEVEKNTHREVMILRTKAKIQQQLLEDRKIDQEREMLFQAKTSAFNIEEVKNHPNPILRNKIRGANSLFEVGAWVNVALQDALRGLNDAPKS